MWLAPMEMQNCCRAILSFCWLKLSTTGPGGMPSCPNGVRLRCRGYVVSKQGREETVTAIGGEKWCRVILPLAVHLQNSLAVDLALGDVRMCVYRHLKICISSG